MIVMRAFFTVSMLLVPLAAVQSADTPDGARATMSFCPPCSVFMTGDEIDAMADIIDRLKNCGDPDCEEIGYAMETMSFTFYDDNWPCEWYPEDGCEGESFGDGTAWVSRGGLDGLGENARYEATTALHEAAHYALYLDEYAAQAMGSACESAIQWWG